MIAFAHILDDVLKPLQPYLIGFALMCWGFAAVSMIRAARVRETRILGAPKRVPRGFVMGAAAFALVIGGEFALSGLIQRGARLEIRPLLSSRVESLSVNGAAFKDPDKLVSALRGMFSLTMAHHSHPTNCFRVLLQTTDGPLELDPCRDSDDPHEYWVYYPNFNTTRANEVGHAFTDALDGM